MYAEVMTESPATMRPDDSSQSLSTAFGNLSLTERRQSRSKSIPLKIITPQVKIVAPVNRANGANAQLFFEDAAGRAGQYQAPRHGDKPLTEEEEQKLRRTFFIECVESSGDDGPRDYLHWRIYHPEVNPSTEDCFCFCDDSLKGRAVTLPSDEKPVDKKKLDEQWKEYYPEAAKKWGLSMPEPEKK